MINPEKTIFRHNYEASLLRQALEGNASAANSALSYLSSNNPSLHRIMQETIHDLQDAKVWRHLLHCLAFQRWNDTIDCERRSDPEASQRLDQSITDVFIQDENETEKSIKESVILEALKDPVPLIQQAAAYLLGLRGNPQAISALERTVETGSKKWKLRAIQALGALRDELCGYVLIKALAMDDEALHREAGQALFALGGLATPAWLKALHHPDSHIRWHAARALSEIGDARAAQILAEGLCDENQAVRWASARALARLDSAAIPAILSVLTSHEIAEPFRQAVYHALHAMASRQTQERIKPLLEALHGPGARVEAPIIAQRLLIQWKEPKKRSRSNEG